MKTTPAISVIVTAYNREDTIRRAIDSIRLQTFKDVEIIVVDDASTDRTAEIVEAISQGAIKLIRNVTQRGIGGAKNVGIDNSTGRYIAFLDSDDAWLPDKLRIQFEALEASGADTPLSFTAFYIYRAGNTRAIPRQPTRYKSWRRSILLGETLSLGSTLLARRSLFGEIGGFNEQLTRLQDRDWTLRYLDRYRDFIVISEPLAEIFNSGWPKVETVKHSTMALFEANRDRLSNWDSDASRLFKASLQFEVAVANCRAGSMSQGISGIASVILQEPRLATHIARRMVRKLGSADFR